MIAAIHNEPDFSELFMSYLLARNNRIEEDLVADQLLINGLGGDGESHFLSKMERRKPCDCCGDERRD